MPDGIVANGENPIRLLRADSGGSAPLAVSRDRRYQPLLAGAVYLRSTISLIRSSDSCADKTSFCSTARVSAANSSSLMASPNQREYSPKRKLCDQVWSSTP